MTPDFSTRGRRPSVRALDAVALTVGAALLAYSAATAWRASRAEREAGETIRQLREQSTTAEQRLRQLTAGTQKRDQTLLTRATLTLTAPPAIVLADIEGCLPTGARLDGVSLEYESALKLELTVVARQAEIYDRFLDRLERSRRFTDLSFGSEKRTGEMKTVVRARYVAEEGP